MVSSLYPSMNMSEYSDEQRKEAIKAFFMISGAVNSPENLTALVFWYNSIKDFAEKIEDKTILKSLSYNERISELEKKLNTLKSEQ